MTSSDDPFEEAARREHADRVHREAMIATMRGSIGGRGSTDVRTTIVVFLGPYLLWAALRAANHAWSTISSSDRGFRSRSIQPGCSYWYGSGPSYWRASTGPPKPASLATTSGLTLPLKPDLP
jgi:hypothetical protein